MLRAAISVARRSYGLCNGLIPSVAPAAATLSNINTPASASSSRNFTSLSGVHPIVRQSFITASPEFLQFAHSQRVQVQPPVRSLTKFSIKSGKRKSVKCVVSRFKRLHWGGWIRTRCGRAKKLFKKSQTQRRRLRQHVLVNATQAWLLDSMAGPYWRKPRYYINDPYEPYHERDFPAARTKAIEYWPSKEEYQEYKKRK